MNDRKKSYFLFLFLAILITGITPILVLGTYSYGRSRTVIESNVRLANQNTINQTMMNFESILKFTQNYYTSLSLQNDIYSYLDMELDFYKNYPEIIELQNSLRRGTLFYEAIDKVFFINLEEDWFISNKLTGSFSDKKDSQNVLDILNDERNIYWTFTGEFSLDYRQNVDSDFLDIKDLLLVIKVPLNNTNQTGVIIASFYRYYLDKLMYQIVRDQNVLITNENDMVFYSLDSSKLGKKLDSVLDHENNNYCVSVSDYNGFKYIIGYSKNEVLKNLAPISNLMFLICGVLIVGVVILGFKGSNFFSDTIKLLLSKNDLMELEINNYKLRLDELFFSELIRGNLSKNETDNRAKALGLTDKWAAMCVVSINIKSDETVATDLELLNIKALSHDFFPKANLLTSIIIGNSIVLPIGSNEPPEKFLENVNQNCVQLRDALNKKFLSAVIGISSVFADLADTKDAFKQSLSGIINKNITDDSTDESGPTKIRFYDKLVFEESVGSRYPKKLVSELLNTINTYDEILCVKIISDIFDQIFTQDASLSEFQTYLMRLSLDILQILDKYGDAYKKILDNFMGMYEEIFLQIADTQGIKELFTKKLIIPAINLLKSHEEDSQSQIVDKVIKIIREEYDKDLTIEECAERVNYHPTYIWRAFSNKLNTNFTSYLLSYRHEMAKQMLLNDTMTISEISQKLTYNNPQNFIRAFKKYEGMTPGEYRKSGISKQSI